jgi:ABC-2 type transport system permease protein
VNAMFTIARNEFSMVARNPLVILFGAILFITIIALALGNSVTLPKTPIIFESEDVFIEGVSYIFANYSLFFALLAVCLGLASMANERSGGSLRVLITKPLYRRDIIIGKFLGISSFLFILMVIFMVLQVSLTIITFRPPYSFIDMVLRVGCFIVLAFLNCSLTLGIVMLLGSIFNKTEALIASLAFISYEWLSQTVMTPKNLGIFQKIDPNRLYLDLVVSGSTGTLFRTYVPFSTWFGNAWPYMVLMVAEVVLVVLIASTIFSRQEV